MQKKTHAIIGRTLAIFANTKPTKQQLYIKMQD